MTDNNTHFSVSLCNEIEDVLISYYIWCSPIFLTLSIQNSPRKYLNIILMIGVLHKNSFESDFHFFKSLKPWF